MKVGRPANTVELPVELGFVNATTGNLHLEIPIASWPQRAGKTTSFKIIYDSHSWKKNFGGGFPPLAWVSVSPWRFIVEPTGGRASSTVTTTACPTGGSGSYTKYENFMFEQPDGTTRRWPALWTAFTTNCSGPGTQSSTTGFANDGSGYRMDVVNHNDITVFAPDGTKVYPGLIDTNGDFYSFHPTLAASVDTLGRTLAVWTIDSSNPNIEYFDVRASDGTNARYTVTFAFYNAHSDFRSGDSEFNGTLKLIQSIQLPNGSAYTFDYDSGTTAGHYGTLTRITLPTGATIDYTYTDFLNGFVDQQGDLVYKERWVSSRTSGGGLWRYIPQQIGTCAANPPCSLRQTVIDPAGNETVYETNTGRFPISVRFYKGSSTSGGELLKTITTEYSAGDRISRQTTTFASGLTSKIELDYASPSPTNRNVSQIREWDFYTGTPPAPTRTTTFTYLNTTPYTSKNIIDRATNQSIFNSAGTLIAKTDVDYDGTPITGTSGAPNHDYTNFGSGNTVRGNPTHIKRWLNTTGATLITINTYDDLGNLLSTKDPGNHTTTFSYTDDWADSSCPLSNTQAYATQTTNALGHRVRNRYYTCTGLVQSARDENDIVAARAGTTFTYDKLNRPLITTYTDLGQTNISYNDTSLPASATTLTKIDTTRNASETTFLDGFGRTWQTQLVDPDCTFGPVVVNAVYDKFGRKASDSNADCYIDDESEITQFTYDALGRTRSIVPTDGWVSFDGSECTTCTQHIYADNAVTVIDPAGKQRTTYTDALGRITRVDEPGQPAVLTTLYQYDALDNLTRVEQRGGDSNPANWRIRTFVYDSLSRLTSASNPESGTTTYQYDNDGNLLIKTSPAPNQTPPSTATQPISYCYDTLHRLTKKFFIANPDCINGSAPQKYLYDQPSFNGLTITNGIGRRTGMQDSSGQTAWSFDVMGRTLAERRTIGSVTKSMNYTYNLDGSVASLVYPNPSSNRTITYTYNVAQRPVSAADAANSINYATNAHYDSSGALSTMNTGSSATSGGVNHTYAYNTRLQLAQITAQAVGAASPVFDLSYDYHFGAGNNGNVFAITNNRDATRSQSFTYDGLNRLATAETTTSNLWANSFQYDGWGNLNKMLPYNAKPEGQHFDQLSNVKNQLIGYSYDIAGNLLNDGLGHTLTYDAEGNIATAGGVTYTYDGDGRRVKKSSGTLYWRGMQDDPLAESDLSGVITREFIFFNGRRIAFRTSAQQYRWYLTDHLGSSRKIISAAAGNTYDDADFYPFGGERTFITPSSGNNYKFTGKERDAESGLDNFEARMFGSVMGRFTSPDDAFADQDEADPQSWNLYSYARNNPINAIDPSGQKCVTIQDADGNDVVGDDGQQGPCTNMTGGSGKPDATVTPSYDQDERIQLLSYHMTNLMSPSSLSEVGVNGIQGAMTAEAVWNLPGLFRNVRSLLQVWRTGGGAKALAQTVLSGSKQLVKANLKSLGLSAAQEAKVLSALKRATNEAIVSVEKLADGSVKVTTSTPGVNAGQSIVKVIDKAGNTVSVEQVHLDSAGRTVVDRKL